MDAPRLTLTYQQDGCALIAGFLTAAKLQALRTLCQVILERWRAQIGAQEQRQRLINLSRLEALCTPTERPTLHALTASPAIRSLLDQLKLSEALYLNSQLFFNPQGFEKDGYWHRDDQYLGLSEAREKAAFGEQEVLHMHLPLLDDDLFEFLPGSHKRWDSELENKVRYNKDGHKQSDPLPGQRAYPASAGDAIVFSAHGLHRGREYRQSPARLTLDLLYARPTKEIEALLRELHPPLDEALR